MVNIYGEYEWWIYMVNDGFNTHDGSKKLYGIYANKTGLYWIVLMANVTINIA